MRSVPVGHCDSFPLFHVGGTLFWQTWVRAEEGRIQDGSRWEEGLHVGGHSYFSGMGWIVWVQSMEKLWIVSAIKVGCLKVRPSTMNGRPRRR